LAKKINFTSFEELKSSTGKEIGLSEWFQMTQNRINDFADATLDHQWIHIDKERSERESPYKKSIAHGFLVLSLIPYFLSETVKFENVKMGINYGLDKVRFTNAVVSDARIRARITVLGVEDVKGGVKYKTKVVVEIENQEKPACIAETIAILLE
jgi:acyl dehydratase